MKWTPLAIGALAAFVSFGAGWMAHAPAPVEIATVEHDQVHAWAGTLIVITKASESHDLTVWRVQRHTVYLPGGRVEVDETDDTSAAHDARSSETSSAQTAEVRDERRDVTFVARAAPPRWTAALLGGAGADLRPRVGALVLREAEHLVLGFEVTAPVGEPGAAALLLAAGVRF